MSELELFFEDIEELELELDNESEFNDCSHCNVCWECSFSSLPGKGTTVPLRNHEVGRLYCLKYERDCPITFANLGLRRNT